MWNRGWEVCQTNMERDIVSLWKTDKGFQIKLLRPNELKLIPNGSVLFDVFGKPHVVGTDKIDLDTRFGFTAFGIKIQEKK